MITIAVKKIGLNEVSDNYSCKENRIKMESVITTAAKKIGLNGVSDNYSCKENMIKWSK